MYCFHNDGLSVMVVGNGYNFALTYNVDKQSWPQTYYHIASHVPVHLSVQVNKFSTMVSSMKKEIIQG